MKLSIFKISAVVAYLALTILGSARAADPAPELDLWDLNGQMEKLTQYRGKIVILNFWATWCVPCQEELPLLAEERKRYGDRIVVIAASVDDATTVKKVRPFAKGEAQFSGLDRRDGRSPAAIQTRRRGPGDCIPRQRR